MEQGGPGVLPGHPARPRSVTAPMGGTGIIVLIAVTSAADVRGRE